MANFRVGYFPDFQYGEPAILIGADRDGMQIFQAALRRAHETGTATFDLHGIRHIIIRQADCADIELNWQTIVWRFDDSRLVEIDNLATSLVEHKGSGHQYLDHVKSPAATVILSVDEYVDNGPFTEFPQGLPAPSDPTPPQSDSAR